MARDYVVARCEYAKRSAAAQCVMRIKKIVDEPIDTWRCEEIRAARLLVLHRLPPEDLVKECVVRGVRSELQRAYLSLQLTPTAVSEGEHRLRYLTLSRDVGGVTRAEVERRRSVCISAARRIRQSSELVADKMIK